jgi:uncharacterized membrane protein YfcA
MVDLIHPHVRDAILHDVAVRACHVEHEAHRVVPFKNLLAGCLRGVAVVVLVVYGEIAWGYGIPMAVGGLIGGYLGGALTGRVSRTMLRAVVISIGLGLAAYYFWTLYGRSTLHVFAE